MVHDKAKQVLKEFFGYDSFLPLQEEIIDNVLNQRETLVVMPTGGGKSLCYQIPALIFEGLTVVVSPLISLMKDQVEQLRELGAPAVYLNSSLSSEEYRDNIAGILHGQVKILYLAPETFLMDRTLALLDSRKIACLAIDEAHCISEWGHDFRPEYRKLAEIRTRFPHAVCVALTATATPRVQKDIKASLSFTDANEFIAGFDRPNLFLEIREKNTPRKQTVSFIQRFQGQSGIVFCATRRKVDDLTAILTEEGFSAAPYHAGMSDFDRRRNQERFIRDDVDIIVATIAFGMGINKPDIRFVLHYDLPKNIESYYQQIGRAGRDGLYAHCLLLFSYGDIYTIKYLIDQKNEQEKKVARLHLNTMIGLCEYHECRRMPLLTYFGEKYTGMHCGMCDNCTLPARKRENVTIQAQKFLSCALRTGEIFGAGHLIDVLRGSKAQKVIDRGHHNLSTYGIGLEHSKREWFFLARQFIQSGLLHQDPEHGSLSVTKMGWKVLRSKEDVYAVPDETSQTTRDMDEKRQTKESREYDNDLFALLRKKRKELADASNVPPYVIFHNTTLLEMAKHQPKTPEELFTIQGVGNVKLKRYGDEFLRVIRNYHYSSASADNQLP